MTLAHHPTQTFREEHRAGRGLLLELVDALAQRDGTRQHSRTPSAPGVA